MMKEDFNLTPTTADSIEHTLSEDDYKLLLEHLAADIKSTRISIARRINGSVMQLYWKIGQQLSERTVAEGYGSAIIKRLSADLKAEFPNMGFSPRNLWDMKRFYERFSATDQKLQQLVAVLPWGHNLLLMNKLSSPDAILYYANEAVKQGWTRNVLLNYIKADAYGQIKLLKQHNFATVLPDNLQEQADEILKSRYNLAFLGVEQPLKELEMEKMLVEKIRFLILELGNGYSFIGNQYRLELNGKEYFVDMLFFNRCTKSLVAIELKIGDFKPEYVSKMGFYLSLLDKNVRLEGENPSIGIILCADKDNDEVEIALQTANAPIGVAEYQLNFPEQKIKELIRNEIKNQNNIIKEEF